MTTPAPHPAKVEDRATAAVLAGSRLGRVLISGPVFLEQGIGGLQDVLGDLADGLRAYGWDVESMSAPDEVMVESAEGPLTKSQEWRRTLAAVSRRIRVPDSWRFLARVVVHDARWMRQASRLLAALERCVRSGCYAAVLVCVDNAPVGFAALVTRIHPRAVLISLTALGWELRQRRALQVVRGVARRVPIARLHPDLFRVVDPQRIHAAVFASATWRDDGVAAGVPPSAARVIHFGIRTPARPPDNHGPHAPVRLLWAARLSSEKGLHFFLPAVALVRRTLPLTLTVLHADGSAAYRSHIARTIGLLGLADIVDMRLPVPREQLADVLTAHDVFLFFSVFREPVAQMLLLAYAAGLVVVGPDSGDPLSPLRPGDTAFCFSSRRPEDIAAAIRRAATDEVTRRAVRARAFALAARDHSLAETIAAHHRLLLQLTAGARIDAGRP